MTSTCVAVSRTLPSSPARTAERGSHPAPALVTGQKYRSTACRRRAAHSGTAGRGGTAARPRLVFACTTDPCPPPCSCSPWSRRRRRAPQALVRMRALVESAPDPKPAGSTPLLPNLKAVPPFEFGFVAPANPANAAYPPDTVNPPLSVAGQQPMECTIDEMAPITLGGGGATGCLRFTSGPINA